MIQWPPLYTLKRHARSKHVKFKASQKNGLEIVVPVRFNLKKLDNILNENKAWIINKLNELSQISPVKEVFLPSEIYLKSINQLWKVSYIESDNKKIRLYTRPFNEIVLLGDIKNIDECLKLLTFWCRKIAAKQLPLILIKVSEEMKLNFSKVSVRNQQTRWGSCNSEKSISLNYKILFLPEPLMKHILIHELCHTVHLNHSTRFWKLVSAFDTEWKNHSREIKKDKALIPDWLI